MCFRMNDEIFILSIIMSKSYSEMLPYILLTIIALAFLYVNVGMKKTDFYADYQGMPTSDGVVQEAESQTKPSIETVNKEEKNGNVVPYTGESSSMNYGETNSIDLSTCGNGGQFISSNLLPKNDQNLEDSFVEFAPSLEGKNFLTDTAFQIGHQSQSLRNANYQLRSDPVNPQDVVCPWMQSTIHPEKRRPLHVGAA